MRPIRTDAFAHGWSPVWSAFVSVSAAVASVSAAGSVGLGGVGGELPGRDRLDVTELLERIGVDDDPRRGVDRSRRGELNSDRLGSDADEIARVAPPHPQRSGGLGETDR